MQDIRSTIMQLSGHWGNECYRLLCLAVEVALSLEPEDFQMKIIWSELHARSGKSVDAVSRALSRAAVDIWQHGDREKLQALFGRPLKQAPMAKELVRVLTDSFRPRIEYHVWEDAHHEFGLLGKSTCGDQVLAVPFTKDRERATRLAHSLTLCQKPLSEFRLLALTCAFSDDAQET